jgi:hypothetical protein
MKKTSKHLTVMAIIAIITLSLIVLSCDKDKDDDPPPETATVPQPTQKTLTFGSVTISSPDQHLPSAWNALCNDVVTALESAYDGAGNAFKNQFRTIFGNDAGAQIVLVKNLANNWEVKDGEFKTLYLKTGSIATAGYVDAINNMEASVPQVGKATPPKHRVFLA